MMDGSIVVGVYAERKAGDIISRIKPPSWVVGAQPISARVVKPATRAEYEACIAALGGDPTREPNIEGSFYYWAHPD